MDTFLNYIFKELNLIKLVNFEILLTISNSKILQNTIILGVFQLPFKCQGSALWFDSTWFEVPVGTHLL